MIYPEYSYVIICLKDFSLIFSENYAMMSNVKTNMAPYNILINKFGDWRKCGKSLDKYAFVHA